MLTLLFLIFLVSFIWNTIVLAVKMTWGLAKIMAFIIFFPVILIGMVLAGLAYIALPVLIIAGIVSFLAKC